MNLRKKIPLLITLTLTALITVLYFAMRLILMRSITTLEERDVSRNLSRISDAIQNELERLTSTAGDYASWDDTYRFIQDRNTAYIKTNINAETMANLKINLFALLNKQNTLIQGVNINLLETSLSPLPGSDQKILEQTPKISDHQTVDSRIKGLLVMPSGPLMFASRPIITSNFEGPIRGSLIVGKYLDQPEILQLSEITHLSFHLNLLTTAGPNQPLPEGITLQDILNQKMVSIPISQDTVLGFTIIRDLNGKPAFIIELSSARHVYKQGLRTLRYFLSALIFIGVFFLFLTLLLLESQILRRLSRLNRDVGHIKNSRTLQSRITLRGQDEIAELGGEINRMLEAIERSSAEVRESEKKFRLTFESAKNAIVWVDTEKDIIINCNREAEKLFEHTKLDLIGQPHSLLFEKGREPSDTQVIKMQSDSNSGFETETEVVTGKERIRNVIISASITTISGKRLVQEVFRDITRQKAIEKERAQLEEQLRQSQKMEVIGQLAGGVAHDFNNMLAGISGYSDLIRRKFGLENPTLERYALTIFDTAKNAAELTSKLLAFARKGKHELVTINMHDIIQDVIKLIEHSLDKRIRISQYLRAMPATVVGDRSQIQNALLNLCMNAGDAMPNGGELALSTENTVIDTNYTRRHPYKLIEGQYLLLSVTDSGVGMDENVKSKLFEPFFTTKGPGKGTGLGLASVYGTIKGHNGSIECYSEVGKGTTFKIYLPVVNREGTPVPVVKEVIYRGTARILIIDDEALVRNVAAEILTELGYHVSVTNDGQEGLEYYQVHQSEIDLIVLDMIMPRLSGFECFMALKKLNPDIRVIISSGYSMNNETAKVLSAGARGFVSKPFDIGKLSKAIAEALI